MFSIDEEEEIVNEESTSDTILDFLFQLELLTILRPAENEYFLLLISQS